MDRHKAKISTGQQRHSDVLIIHMCIFLWTGLCYNKLIIFPNYYHIYITCFLPLVELPPNLRENLNKAHFPRGHFLWKGPLTSAPHPLLSCSAEKTATLNPTVHAYYKVQFNGCDFSTYTHKEILPYL